ncbi:glycoside hydrolase family 2 protein [Mangrovibacterium diazotrophicum]|uniref:beta-galactosidase n=1 Tax=Mangrovibacterium diazotrophicum TaxID=1261403 RepID=A0A419W635_9BACT|nr:sugar-binding domain-containing protein [Mangrovibacterium diazotrophicum]RKD90919.1 glycosyl hydrolase family 2 [Mangrovibacterium diazotrophicum]
MKRSILAWLFPLLVLAACAPNSDNRIDLSGEWQFATDPTDMGKTEKWYAENLKESVLLPGSMAENDKGDIPDLYTPWTGTIYDSSFYFNPALEKYRQPGDVKFPFWLTPNKYYKGAAWYRKEVTVPENWSGKRVVLHLERPHWQTSVWVNDQKAGYENSLSTPHDYDVTKLLKTGSNFITVCVDNRTDSINVGPDSHSVSDHTQGNWNGMVGELYLQAGSPLYIADMQLFPNIETKTVKAIIQLKTEDGSAVDAEVHLQARLKTGDAKTLPMVSQKAQFSAGGKVLEVEYDMGDDVKLWDEFSPNLYEMTATLEAAGMETDELQQTFGMRKVEIADGKILVNGRPVFMRGTLECNTFPLTGYPPTDVESWKAIMQTCKESGLNHIRFHSHCPPEAAFIAADELGMYVQPEAASWPNHGTSLGDGRPTDDYIVAETERIIKAYGNHPSFVMYAYCNEPYGNYVPFLDKDLQKWKSKDPRRIYTAAAIGRSWSVNPESEYLVRSIPRGLPFNLQPNATFNYDERIADESRPYVTHEMGQYCVFPDFSEIEKYTGVYKAKNFEMFKGILEDNHMGDQAHDFLMASGKLQALCYKAEIEAEFRTTTLDGFQLLGLNDFPGQGSAIIGMLNVFWQEKGYVTKEEISRYCNETVPLAEFPKFVFTNDESLDFPVSVSHYGAEDLKDVIPTYSIATVSGDTLATGDFGTQTITIGQLSTLGTLDFPLDELSKAVQCKLEVDVAGFMNSWDFWVFPAKQSALEKDDIYYTDKLDQAAMEKLDAGASVLLDASGKIENGKDIVANFTPVFWNTSWFKMRPPHTTGIWVQEDHPALKDFPTSYHSDYQWWEIVNGQQVMCIDSFPPAFRPIVQPIDTWFLSRRLAQLFEAKVGNGKLLVTTLNIETTNGPASAQLRQSLVNYMNSTSFQPKYELDAAVILELFEKKDRQGVNLYTKGTPDELKPTTQKTQKK